MRKRIKGNVTEEKRKGKKKKKRGPENNVRLRVVERERR